MEKTSLLWKMLLFFLTQFTNKKKSRFHTWRFFLFLYKKILFFHILNKDLHLVIGRLLVCFPWSACWSVLGQDTEPQAAPDVLVGTLHGSYRHQCMNTWITVSRFGQKHLINANENSKIKERLSWQNFFSHQIERHECRRENNFWC